MLICKFCVTGVWTLHPSEFILFPAHAKQYLVPSKLMIVCGHGNCWTGMQASPCLSNQGCGKKGHLGSVPNFVIFQGPPNIPVQSLEASQHLL